MQVIAIVIVIVIVVMVIVTIVSIVIVTGDCIFGLHYDFILIN